MLGRSGIEVSAMGIGCWAMGGDGWGTVDDGESIRAIQEALDLGITLIDTANVYGFGRSEQVVGKAVAGRRDKVVIATKFGYGFEEMKGWTNTITVSPEEIVTTCNDSLRRLNTDYIDLYQLHYGQLPGEEAYPILDTLDQLVQEGKIRTYGWSTDIVANAAIFAERLNCTAIQHQLNLFYDNPEMVALCERENLASINRGPLAMGVLTGKFDSSTQMPTSDVRGSGFEWVPYFDQGKLLPEFAEKIQAIREILTSDGRTLAQGALAWIWGLSPSTIPIPGAKTIKQVRENVGAMKFGPLSTAQMEAISQIAPAKLWTW